MQIVRKVALGRSGTVYEAEESGSRFAVKIFFEEADFHNEVANFHRLPDHRNLTMMLSADDQGLYSNGKTGQESKVRYIKTDFCVYQDIQEMILKPKIQVPGPIVRFCIQQILEGLDAMHDNDIAHCDIKPQNCMLNGDLEIKLGDFESSAHPMNAVSGLRGTMGYMPPEIKNEVYDGKCADYFALGVSSFVMLMGKPMFAKASFSDRHYKHILNNDFDSFWKAHKNLAPSTPFRDFVERFVESDPEHRIQCSDEVRAHPWMQKYTADKSEVLKYVKSVYKC